MRCPNCGKKMKGTVCKHCGHNTAAAAPASYGMPVGVGPQVNYFSYDPMNPSVVYPMGAQPQMNPMMAQPQAAPMAYQQQMPMMQNGVPANNNVSVNKHTASRLFSIVILAIIALLFTVIPYYVMTQDSIILVKSGSELVTSILSAEYTVFGFLPAFGEGSMGHTLYNLSIYVFLGCCVTAAIISVCAMFSTLKAPRRVRRALFFLGIGAFAYTISFIVGVNQMFPEATMAAESFLGGLGFVVDFYSLLIGASCALLSFFFLIFRKRDKKN